MLKTATTTRPRYPRLADPKPLGRPPIDFHHGTLGDDAPPDARDALGSIFTEWEKLHVAQHSIDDHRRLAAAAQRIAERVLAGAEKSIGRLKAQRESLHNKICETVRPPAHREPLGVEIRAYLKARKSAFLDVDQAMRRGDLLTTRAVLAAPGYLSGLDDNQQALLFDRARQVFTPDDYTKLKSLDAATDRVEAFAKRFGGEMAEFIRERQDRDTTKLEGLEK